MPENRIAENYLALEKTVTSPITGIEIPSAFMPITSISILPDRYVWAYGVYGSRTLFSQWKNASRDFPNLSYSLHGAEYESFKTTNTELLAELDSRLRALCLPAPTENAALISAHFEPADWRLSIRYSDRDDFPQREMTGDTYHALIAANMDVIGFDAQGNPGLIPLLHAAAAQKDPDFWNGATLVLPE